MILKVCTATGTV